MSNEKGHREQDVAVVMSARHWGMVKPFISDIPADFETGTEEREAAEELDDAIEHALARHYEEAQA